MWCFLRRTNGYHYTVNTPTKWLDTTHVCYNNSTIISYMSSYYDPDRFSNCAGNIFCARKIFRTGNPPSRTGNPPSQTGNPPESTRHDSYRPRWPSHSNSWAMLLYIYPERAGIPGLERDCHSSLGSSGDISIPHSGVSRGHRNVPL